jgi:hypothetical protein
VVIRPGCYITHDVGIYEIARQELIARDPIACDLGGDLTSALELMAMVQSVPEADRAVVNFGKRDCADAGLTACRPLSPRQSITAAGRRDSQRRDYGSALHAAPGAGLRCAGRRYCAVWHLSSVSDLDKWKTLLLVDDEYRARGAGHLVLMTFTVSG